MDSSLFLGLVIGAVAGIFGTLWRQDQNAHFANRNAPPFVLYKHRKTGKLCRLDHKSYVRNGMGSVVSPCEHGRFHFGGLDPRGGRERVGKGSGPRKPYFKLRHYQSIAQRDRIGLLWFARHDVVPPVSRITDRAA